MSITLCKFLFITMISFYNFFVIAALPAESSSLKKGEYGRIYFPSSASSEMQPLFIKGVLLLHHFQYDDARKVFIELQKKEPGFALAYWGEAMTYNHPLWNEQDLTAGQKALQKLAKTPEERIEKAKTPQEKGLIEAINILYDAKGDKKHRDYLYTIALRNLYKQFPEDDEIATFYALALLGKEQGVRNVTEYMKAASIANDVFIRNPQHPGAMHYLIHAVDDFVHAPLGLNAARAYSLVAPDASHATHMPSHIYLALGLWEEVVKSNEQAWESGKKRIKQQNLSFKDYDIHDLHALQWLQYGYLQLGNYDKAKELLKTMYQMTLNSDHPMFKWYYGRMRAAQAVSTKDYTEIPPSVDMLGVELSATANNFYTEALIRESKAEDLESLGVGLKKLIAKEKVRLENQKEPGSDYFTSVNGEGLTIAEITLLQIMALNQKNKNLSAEAYKNLEKAVDIENSLPTGYGPPNPVKPSKELLGEFLFRDKNFSKACAVFQEELLTLPNRREALEKLNQIDKNLRCPKRENIFFHRLFYQSFI